MKDKCDLARLTRNGLIDFIKDKGGERLQGDTSVYFRFTDPKKNVLEGKERMWAIRNVERWRKASPAEIGAEYFKAPGARFQPVLKAA